MITAILNCYRRPQNLKLQIEAVLNQTEPAKDIWVWVNHHEDHQKFDWDGLYLWLATLDSKVKIFDCNHNWKYCGRFAAACLVDTEFTAIFDDDTIPGPKWFDNCLSAEVDGGILGGIGVKIQTTNAYQPNQRYGWINANQHTVQVDLVGHAWFFPSDYVRKYMWRHKPFWDNGEDMHFSAMCQIYGGIETYVPPHPRNDTEMWSSLYGQQLGVDSVASSAVRNHRTFYEQRNGCVQKLVKLGWKLQCCS
jgi:hypothetical protein